MLEVPDVLSHHEVVTSFCQFVISHQSSVIKRQAPPYWQHHVHVTANLIIMDESETMEETTPLLSDSPQPYLQSALLFPRGYHGNGTCPSPSSRKLVLHSHSSPRHRSSLGYPRQQFHRRSQVHPLHKSSNSASSFRPLNTSSLPPPAHSSFPYNPNFSPPKLNRILPSLPYQLLCIASPLIPPCCGLCCCLTCIRTSEYGILERFGKFERILEPGMHSLVWPMEREAGRVSVRVQQLDVHCEAKSKDHGMYASLFNGYVTVSFSF